MTNPPSTLSDRVVLLTGVSRDIAIGAAIARCLAARGADLFLTSWPGADAVQPWGASPHFADELVDELRASGTRVGHLAVDLADPSAPATLFDAAVAEFGHVDALVANHARSSNQDLANLTTAELDACFAVNTRASLLLAQQFAARYDDRRTGGRIVLFTSGQHLGAMPDELPYVVSKGAIASDRKPGDEPGTPRHHRELREPRADGHRLGNPGRDRPADASPPARPLGAPR